jgi:hypothetical protein
MTAGPVRPLHLPHTGSHSRLPPRGIWGGMLRSSLSPISHRFEAPASIRGKKKRLKWKRWREARTRVRVYAIVQVFKDEYEDESKPDRIEIDTVLVGASLTVDEARAMTRERIFARVTHPDSHPIEVLALVAGRSFAEIRKLDAKQRHAAGAKRWLHRDDESTRRRKWWTVKTEKGDSDRDREARARLTARRVRETRRRSKKKRRR